MSQQEPREEPSEQSPLLADRRHAENGHVTGDAEHQPADAEQDGTDEVVLADEASNKKLVAILFTLFIGVFFAALGTNPPRLGHAIPADNFRHNGRRNTVRAHIVRVRLTISPLLARYWLLDR